MTQAAAWALASWLAAGSEGGADVQKWALRDAASRLQPMAPTCSPATLDARDGLLVHPKSAAVTPHPLEGHQEVRWPLGNAFIRRVVRVRDGAVVDVQPVLDAGHRALLDGELTAAKAALDAASLSDAEHPEVHALKARVLARADGRAAAQGEVDAARKADPDGTAWHVAALDLAWLDGTDDQRQAAFDGCQKAAADAGVHETRCLALHIGQGTAGRDFSVLDNWLGIVERRDANDPTLELTRGLLTLAMAQTTRVPDAKRLADARPFLTRGLECGGVVPAAGRGRAHHVLAQAALSERRACTSHAADALRWAPDVPAHHDTLAACSECAQLEANAGARAARRKPGNPTMEGRIITDALLRESPTACGAPIPKAQVLEKVRVSLRTLSDGTQEVTLSNLAGPKVTAPSPALTARLALLVARAYHAMHAGRGPAQLRVILQGDSRAYAVTVGGGPTAPDVSDAAVTALAARVEPVKD